MSPLAGGSNSLYLRPHVRYIYCLQLSTNPGWTVDELEGATMLCKFCQPLQALQDQKFVTCSYPDPEYFSKAATEGCPTCSLSQKNFWGQVPRETDGSLKAHWRRDGDMLRFSARHGHGKSQLSAGVGLELKLITLNDDSLLQNNGCWAGTTLHVDPLSDACIKVMDDWIAECLHTHSICPGDEEVQLPTRVIDVGPTNGSEDPRLVISDCRHGKYITLSHSWGKIPTITTGKATLQERLNGIPLSSLPRNFSDAILITRKFGVQYLWIDSLCILQDDIADWATESARMADVYGKSYLTIAATTSINTGTGILHERRGGVMPDKIGNNPEQGENLYVLPHIEGWQGAVEQAPLNLRAWTLQERLLSPRVLQFSKQQIFLECQTTVHSESGIVGVYNAPISNRFPYNGVPKSILMHHDGMLKNKEADPKLFQVYSDWYTTVRDYSKRALTKGRDKLVALSGCAHEIQETLHDTYLAGLWQRDLQRGLLWLRVGRRYHPRPHTYRAPSWSWAGLDVAVRFPCGSSLDLPHEMEVIDCEINLVHDDHFGEISSATLTLRGKLFRSTLLGESLGAVLKRDGIVSEFDPDEMDIDEAFAAKGSYFFFYVTRTRNWFWYLVLEAVDAADGVYKRVGLLQELQMKTSSHRVEGEMTTIKMV
ncbi:MAG: hypothetical protein M1834_002446 [Cirrosporium novae-zelandiae]|nr:MAG: hypothetical protein M1834_002446 [Cirrosporium novae-zelandiae]